MPHPSREMLEQIMLPAFLVKDGTVICTNTPAAQHNITTDTTISDLISIGAEEFYGFTGGKLSLALSIGGVDHPATVSVADDCYLFVLESDYDSPEMLAYALVAQNLREPLANVMASAQQLSNQAVSQDEYTRDKLADIQQNLHRILRMISNMSDSGKLVKPTFYQLKACDAVWVFDEMLEKAAALLAESGRKLEYSLPGVAVNTSLDSELLGRAVHNLISNAAKYSPAGTDIRAKLKHNGNRLVFTVENDLTPDGMQNCGNLFHKHLRQPGLESGKNGLGLGMSIVRNVAMAHGGTVLAELLDQSRMRITLTIAVRETDDALLRSPIQLPVDYSGGFDHTILELSDVLSAHLYNQL